MSSTVIKCPTCANKVLKKSSLACVECKNYFHLQCAGHNESQLSSLTTQFKSTWRCPICVNQRKKGGNSANVLVRGLSQTSPSSCTETSTVNASPQATCSKCLNTTKLDEITLASIKNEINKSVTEAIHAVHNVLEAKFTDLINKVSDLTSTVEFFSNKYDELKSRLDSRDKEVVELLTQNRVLEETVKDLGFRLSSLEQHSRECNVEINGLPEFKSENLVQTVLQIGKTVSHTINDTDVMSCFRVAKKDNNNKRPRAAIVKFRSPRNRDAFLTAYYKYNRENRLDKLSTQAIGIGGDRAPIYLSEHLSPPNKMLHAATRKKAKEISYNFVWVRNGKIYVRKDEKSSAKVINNMTDLDKLK
ncbi:unnamed protein product, partial [Brenthis ino]